MAPLIRATVWQARGGAERRRRGQVTAPSQRGGDAPAGAVDGGTDPVTAPAGPEPRAVPTPPSPPARN
jgi:hypothetical protein